jgi:hypothetical protein
VAENLQIGDLYRITHGDNPEPDWGIVRLIGLGPCGVFAAHRTAMFQMVETFDPRNAEPFWVAMIPNADLDSKNTWALDNLPAAEALFLRFETGRDDGAIEARRPYWVMFTPEPASRPAVPPLT